MDRPRCSRDVRRHDRAWRRVAAYSVVTKDVRPYAIVAGVPASERRRRFTDEQITALLQIAWWDWPMGRILASVPILCAGRIEEFVAGAQSAAESAPRWRPPEPGGTTPSPDACRQRRRLCFRTPWPSCLPSRDR